MGCSPWNASPEPAPKIEPAAESEPEPPVAEGTAVWVEERQPVRWVEIKETLTHPPDLTGQLFGGWRLVERVGPRDYDAYHMSCAFESHSAARIRLIDPANAPLAKLWAGLNHRLFSRLRCLGQFADCKTPAVVLPYHDGSTYLSEGTPVSLQWQKAFCRELLEAAVEAAEAGVKERIFVYNSIWIDDGGRPKLGFPSQHEPETVSAQLFTLLHLALTGRRFQPASRIALPFRPRPPKLNPQIQTLMTGLIVSENGLREFLQGLDQHGVVPAIG